MSEYVLQMLKECIRDIYHLFLLESHTIEYFPDAEPSRHCNRR